jgi:3-oxoacyl-[acyl-carrier protein] reductase
MSSSTPFVVLVTGTRGIGLEIAKDCIRRGATVAMIYHTDLEAANETLAQVLEEGKKSNNNNTAKLFQADLSKPEECKRVFGEVISVFGRLDALINNSGIAPDHDVGNREIDFEFYSQTVTKTMATNFESASNLSFLAIRQFQDQNKTENASTSQSSLLRNRQHKGVIVHITSRAAYRGELTCFGYAASKAAMNIFSQSIAKRFASEQILSFAVAPGWVATSMASAVMNGPDRDAVLAQHPLGRIALPEEVANCVSYCVFDAPAAMTGTILDVNGASYAC